MKRGLRIFLLFLVFLILCSFTSVNAEDANNIADVVGENNIGDNFALEALENDGNINHLATNDNSMLSDNILEEDNDLDNAIADSCNEKDSNEFTLSVEDESIDNESNGNNLVLSENDVNDLSDNILGVEENNDNSDLSDNILGIDENNDNSFLSDNILGVEENNDNSDLSSDSDQNLGVIGGLPFAQLATFININMPLGVIGLTSDYSFNLTTDEAFALGISLHPTMDTIIDGNGHSIDGDFKAVLFTIIHAPFSITFRNVNFINAGYSDEMRECYEGLAPPGTGDYINYSML
ncbi:hypothetical protein [uncultured Methanobrevibacter sp.]|uniref:hypothetical protein n=1 Tax=uncultured Methanobrevibacter sp. TaxID=253161 RepID=UPI0025ECCA21|nr:hypothetical protein [uncultured Methanobrevibacter sp.]